MKRRILDRLQLSFYWLSKYVVGAIFTVLFRVKAVNPQNVPPSGPVIIACNHIGYLDPPALGVCAPRPISYMAKYELFDIWQLSWLIRLLYAFPIDRSRNDIGAMKKARTVIKHETTCLGIFPEGTRNKEGVRIEPGIGVALLAQMTDAAVVPAFISGTNDAKKLAQIVVRFGEPLRIEGGRKASREDLAKWSNLLMDKIYELRESPRGH